ncbi:MAG: PaaI family thioesterase, partial [Actinomycetota bacterium]|nr:PaaI family thioesterase [Actinomycetota bacterium]
MTALTRAQPSQGELRARAGLALRELGHALIGHDADDDRLTGIASQLEELTDELGTGDSRERDPNSFDTWGESVVDGAPMKSYDDRPFSGRSSPWGLDIDVHRHGDEARARVRLQEAHEGAPGRSHGGIVAGLFDDMFGFVLGITHQPAFTGELWLRYEAPTPLHRPLSCRARLVRRVGRKLMMTGELIDVSADGEPVLVRATATMIAIDMVDLGGLSAELP